MTPPHATFPAESGQKSGVRPSPLVRRVFGEPRFHTDADIAAITFAPDGSLWSVDEAGLLRHWSDDGKLLKRSFLSDLEILWCFGPRAELLASGNDDLLIWDVAEGTLLHRLEGASWVTALAFSADGDTLASGHDDGTVRFWNARGCQLIGQIAAHPEAVSAIAFSPDGKSVATAGEDRVVRVWDADSHRAITELVSHTDRIPALAWSADGALLASAGWDTSARVWELGQRVPLILLNSHADQVQTLTFAPMGDLLATADSEHDIYLWADPLAGKVAQVLRGHTDEIRCIAFSPDGKRLASGGTDHAVHVWDTNTGELLAGPNPSGRHTIATVSVNGKLRLASAGGSSVRVWDADTAMEVPPSGTDSAYSVAADAKGKLLAVGGTDHFIRLHDLTAPTKPARVLEATKPPIGALAFAPSGDRFAHASPADGLVWIWDPAAGDAQLILIEAADGCTLEGVAFHPDGNQVAVGGIDYLSTGDRDGAVCIWDLMTKRKTATFDVGVYAVAFDPSGRFLAGAGIADDVCVWDLSTDSIDPILELRGHLDRVNAVAFSPDGNYVVSGSDDLTVRVWDVLSGRQIMAREFDSPIRAVAFSPDGTMLFTGNGNTTCYQVEFRKLLEE